MKRKKTKWAAVPWTPFEQVPVPHDERAAAIGGTPNAIFVNSRYQVSAFEDDAGEPFGRVLHLSIKTHDRQAHHDWRDLQRIKNEIAGEECDAVEVYPAESKLVDTANQYHLFVFASFRLPFGFQSRLVADGKWENSKQRPFEVRPADCLDPLGYGAKLQEAIDELKRRTGHAEGIED